jgi:hypothetical protein
MSGIFADQHTARHCNTNIVNEIEKYVEGRIADKPSTRDVVSGTPQWPGALLDADGRIENRDGLRLSVAAAA